MIGSNNILIIQPTTRGHTLSFHRAVALQNITGFYDFLTIVTQDKFRKELDRVVRFSGENFTAA
jgi:hypothetical protein